MLPSPIISQIIVSITDVSLQYEELYDIQHAHHDDTCHAARHAKTAL